MSDGQTIRHRATRVCGADQRVAGPYEQCAEGPGSDRPIDAAALLSAIFGVNVRGRVGRPGRLSTAELRSLAGGARLADLGTCRIAVVDLLTHLRIAADADVLSVTTVDGGHAAFRVDAMLRDPATHFEVGSLALHGAAEWVAALTIVGSGVPGGSLRIRSIDLLTFAEFIGADTSSEGS